ncbi:CAP domain-containing protein [Botrimarina mediterranea]|uniref:Cysteine-rich secretory protein family protein n=1 Tax=Botrimarina mediterranea TaxID=2528022 RepID=A0A518K798_9BACT|nr:CAP domain-containing protein [Botrimarina mediterranea]QDV73660.1 Cysteine-rich secretory protein family protein [Botrimarina mediterranea]QDV78250.1 Cysteine-rich secretory protein family protein [Planctomycetes bacterium K2D]
MPPKNTEPTQRRIVVLPLPLLAVWLVGECVWCAAREVARLASKRKRTSPAHKVVPAACAVAERLGRHHQDSDCRWIAEKLFEHLNAYRIEQGCRPVTWNLQLELSSLYQSTRMGELEEFAHVLSDGVVLPERLERFGYEYERYAENLFYVLAPGKGLGALAWMMHDGWVHSPGHQRNLVGDTAEVGIGVIRDTSGGYYATQNFGTPQPTSHFAPPTRRARHA